jgi:Flp pilus assembly protein TadG
MRAVRQSIRIKGRRGFGMIEFTIVAIPVIFLTTSIIEMSLESWKFHSMMYAIQVADRYACQHGRTCTRNTGGASANSCTITVETVANMISQQAPSLDPSLLDVTLTTHSTTTDCNPLNSCFSTSTTFPNSTDNGVGLPITIHATYPMYNPLPMFWFGVKGPTSGSTFTLGATTTQVIVY